MIKKIASLIGTACLLSAIQVQAEVNIPYSFNNGETADANHINDNFTALKNALETLQDQLSIIEQGLFEAGDNVEFAINDKITAPNQNPVTAYRVQIPAGGSLRVEYFLEEEGSTVYRSIVSRIYVNQQVVATYNTQDSTGPTRLVNHDLEDLEAGDIISVQFHVANSAQSQYINATIRNFKLKSNNNPRNFIRLN